MVLLSSGCATRKRKGDVSRFGKFYHNLTAKYNGYFNANEIMKETYKELEFSHQDNFNQLLPVYPEVSESTAKSLEGELDLAIEKVTTVATIHEVSDYVDDCYVLMGEAQFLKQDYESAEETFEFFQEAFNPNDPSSRNYKKKKKSSAEKRKEKEKEREETRKKKEEERERKMKEREEEQKAKERQRKKEKEERERQRKEESREERIKRIRAEREKNIEKGGIRQQQVKDSSDVNKSPVVNQPTKVNTPPPEPKVVTVAEEPQKIEKREEKVEVENTAYHEGMLWLARTYIEREQYSSAEFLLRRMWNDPTVKEDVKKEIPAAQAHLSIRLEKYDDARGYLATAVETSDKKKNRARYAYILAQLYEMDGNYQAASEAYEQAKKLGSAYEMELNAELNKVKNNILSGQSSINQAEDRLLGMRKEDKNEEFRDRITYVLAEMAIATGDEEKIKKYLSEALRYSNNNQLSADCYFILAEMDYQDEDYISAKLYYDSTIAVMEKNDPRYNNAEKLARNLEEIAKNLEIIELQDSLLRIGELPQEELMAYAKKVLEEQQSAPQNEVANQKKSIQTVKVSKARNLLESSFFAYDNNKVRKGKAAFEEKWGDLVLQDNWRRSASLRITSSDDEEEEIVEEESAPEVDEEALNQIIASLPTDEISRQKAKGNIKNALFNLGVLYREKLENFENAIETHEELLQRFPGSEKEIETYYYLYLSYLDTGNTAGANKYKNLLIEKYPESKFTLAISDPSFIAAMQEEKMALPKFYDNTFAQFNAGNYEKVREMISEAEQRFGNDHQLRAKFGLLSAMTTGHLEGEDAYIKSLQDVVTRYPNTPEQTRAREIMRFLKGDGDAFESVGIDEVDDIFSEENEKLHYIAVVVFNAEEEAFERTKISVSEYNKKNHRLKRLQLADIGLNKTENSKIILVRKFKGKEEAMKYYNDVVKNRDDFVTQDVTYEIYPVTQRNYRKIIDQKGINKYRIWFEARYLNK